LWTSRERGLKHPDVKNTGTNRNRKMGVTKREGKGRTGGKKLRGRNAFATSREEAKHEEREGSQMQGNETQGLERPSLITGKKKRRGLETKMRKQERGVRRNKGEEGPRH